MLGSSHLAKKHVA